MFLSPVSSSVSRSDLTPNGPLLTSVRSFLSSPAPSTERPWGLMSLGAGRSRLRSQPVGSAALNAFLCPSCSNVSSVTRHSDAYVPESWGVGETPSWFPACPSHKAPRLVFVNCAFHLQHERGRLLVGIHLAAHSLSLGALFRSWAAAGGLAHLCSPTLQVAVNT